MAISDSLRTPFPFAREDSPFVVGCGIMFCPATSDAPFGPPDRLGCSLYVADPDELVLTAPFEPDALVDEDGIFWVLDCV